MAIKEITEERYDEMLGILPPALWLSYGFWWASRAAIGAVLSPSRPHHLRRVLQRIRQVLRRRSNDAAEIARGKIKGSTKAPLRRGLFCP
jgi:hypothetical protein